MCHRTRRETESQRKHTAKTSFRLDLTLIICLIKRKPNSLLKCPGLWNIDFLSRGTHFFKSIKYYINMFTLGTVDGGRCEALLENIKFHLGRA